MKGYISYPHVLIIAGSDSGGGAVIAADLKTATALGCYCSLTLTAITAQNTMGVSAIEPVSIHMIEGQAEAVFKDMNPTSVKIGMIHNIPTCEAVIKILESYKPRFVVFDPVMVSASGSPLIEKDTIDFLKKNLFPLSDIVTPNIDELSLLSGYSTDTPELMADAARKLLPFVKEGVLAKGGHLSGKNIVDVYASKNAGALYVVRKKIETQNIHGAGCSLSSAIASYLALGYPANIALKKSLAFTRKAILAGRDIRIGHGKGPVNPGFSPMPVKGRIRR